MCVSIAREMRGAGGALRLSCWLLLGLAQDFLVLGDFDAEARVEGASREDNHCD